MACCPVPRKFPPLIRDCDGIIREATSGESLLVNNVCVPTELLTEDLTIFISPIGHDFTGLGTSAKPYRTIHRAQEAILNLDPGNFRIIIDVASGLYLLNTPYKPIYLYGHKVDIKGKRTAVSTTLSITNIDTAHSTDANFPDLQYFECDIDLSGDSPTTRVGEFIRIEDATGGINHDTLRGLHRIESYNSGTEVATIRIWQKVDVAEIASGSITVTTADVIHSVFIANTAVNDHGIEVDGVHGGNWEWLVIQGNINGFDTHRGLLVQNGGHWSALNPVGFHSWDVGIEALNNGFINADACMISKIFTIGANARQSQIKFDGTAYCNGCGELFVSANEANISATSSVVHSAAETYCALSEKGSTIDLTSANIFFEDTVPLTTAALRAQEFGKIISTSTTLTGFTTGKSTATQGLIEPP
jgi:hypothetical protein